MNHDHHSSEDDTNPDATSGSASTPETPRAGADVLSLIADVERHLERIREVQNRQTTDFADLAERQRRVGEAETALAERADELEATATDLASSRETLESERGELEVLRSELDEVRSGLDDDRACITGREQRIDARSAEVDRRSSELENREHDLIRRIAESEASVAGMQAEMDRMTSDHESRMDEIEQANERLLETESRCGELREIADGREAELLATRTMADDLQIALEESVRTVGELEARILEDERQIGLAGGKLAELAHVIAEQTPRLEQGAEAMALIPRLESRIRDLQEEVAEKHGNDGEFASFRETTRVRIDQLERDLETANARAAEATVEADSERIEALISEARAPLERRIVELESDLPASADGDVVSRDKYEMAKERCLKAERRGDELETALSMANDRGQAREMAKRLRAKAERVGDYARHLDLRRRRLAGLRAAIAKQRGGTLTVADGSALQELQRIEARHRELQEVREFLGRSEQQMVRRWARPRSVAIVAWILVLVAISAFAGWFGVREFVPVPGVAGVTIKAVAPDGRTLVGEDEAAWDTWHQALATDPAFIAMVHQKLAVRGLAEGGESATAAMMAEDLSFEDEGSGRLRLVLAGEDARVLEPTLDVIATSLASQSARLSPRRKDGARATLPTERVTSHGVGYATLVKSPWDSRALGWMAMIAGGFLGASILAIGIVYGLLSRSKRVFEEQESLEHVTA